MVSQLPYLRANSDMLPFFSPLTWSNSSTTGSDSPQSTQGCVRRYSSTNRAFLLDSDLCLTLFRALYSSPPLIYAAASNTCLHALQYAWRPSVLFDRRWNSSSGFTVWH